MYDHYFGLESGSRRMRLSTPHERRGEFLVVEDINCLTPEEPIEYQTKFTYLCFCTLSNPFSNCVTSGVSPDWRPSRPITRQRKLPLE